MALLHDIYASSLRISRASRTLSRCRLFGGPVLAGVIQRTLNGFEDQQRGRVAMGVILDGLQQAQVDQRPPGRSPPSLSIRRIVAAISRNSASRVPMISRPTMAAGCLAQQAGFHLLPEVRNPVAVELQLDLDRRAAQLGMGGGRRIRPLQALSMRDCRRELENALVVDIVEIGHGIRVRPSPFGTL